MLSRAKCILVELKIVSGNYLSFIKARIKISSIAYTSCFQTFSEPVASPGSLAISTGSDERRLHLQATLKVGLIHT